MSIEGEMIQRYQEIRTRLRNPHNAVFDDGIDLRRHRKAACAKVEIEVIKADPAISELPPMPEAQGSPGLKFKLVCRAIILITADEFGVAPDHILSLSRKSKFVVPRGMAMLLIRRMGKSFPAIGAIFKRDHTTVLYSCQRTMNEIELDPEMKRHYDTILERVNEYRGAQDRPAVPTQPEPAMALELENPQGLPQPQIYQLDQAGRAGMATAKAPWVPDHYREFLRCYSSSST